MASEPARMPVSFNDLHVSKWEPYYSPEHLAAISDAKGKQNEAENKKKQCAIEHKGALRQGLGPTQEAEHQEEEEEEEDMQMALALSRAHDARRSKPGQSSRDVPVMRNIDQAARRAQWVAGTAKLDKERTISSLESSLQLEKTAQAAGLSVPDYLVSKTRIVDRFHQRKVSDDMQVRIGSQDKGKGKAVTCEEDLKGKAQERRTFPKVKPSLPPQKSESEKPLSMGGLKLSSTLTHRPGPTPAGTKAMGNVSVAPPVPKPHWKPPPATKMPLAAFSVHHNAKQDALRDEKLKEATKQMPRPHTARQGRGDGKSRMAWKHLVPHDSEEDKPLTDMLWAFTRDNAFHDKGLGTFEVKILEEHAASLFFGPRYAHFDGLKAQMDPAVRFRTRDEGKFFVIGLYAKKHYGNDKGDKRLRLVFHETFMLLRLWADDVRQGGKLPLVEYISSYHDERMQRLGTKEDETYVEGLRREREAAFTAAQAELERNAQARQEAPKAKQAEGMSSSAPSRDQINDSIAKEVKSTLENNKDSERRVKLLKDIIDRHSLLISPEEYPFADMLGHVEMCVAAKFDDGQSKEVAELRELRKTYEQEIVQKAEQ